MIYNQILVCNNDRLTTLWELFLADSFGVPRTQLRSRESAWPELRRTSAELHTPRSVIDTSSRRACRDSVPMLRPRTTRQAVGATDERACGCGGSTWKAWALCVPARPGPSRFHRHAPFRAVYRAVNSRDGLARGSDWVDRPGSPFPQLRSDSVMASPEASRAPSGIHWNRQSPAHPGFIATCRTASISSPARGAANAVAASCSTGAVRRPASESTPGWRGTIVREMAISALRAQAWTGPAPPIASRLNSRGLCRVRDAWRCQDTPRAWIRAVRSTNWRIAARKAFPGGRVPLSPVAAACSAGSNGTTMSGRRSARA